MHDADLDTDVVDSFKARMRQENRRDWDRVFGGFIKALIDGREDVEFPDHSDDDEDVEGPTSPPATTEMTNVMSTEIRRAYPECPDCGGLLDRDGTCPFKANHQRRYGT